MIIRIVFEQLDNSFLTTNMFLKLFKCSNALIIPEDKQNKTVIILDIENKIGLIDKIKKIEGIKEYEVLPEEFDSIKRKLQKLIKQNKIFYVNIKHK